MQALHNGFYSKGSQCLKGGTAQQAIDYVAQKFRSTGPPDPQADLSGNISILIHHQTKGYKNYHPGVKHKKALPISFYCHFMSSAISNFNKDITHLCIGAFFFAMWSCKYTKCSTSRRTKTITLADIRFFKGTIELAHSDPRLHEATTVSITFRFQKRDERDDIITHHRNLDPIMCPVKAWAYVVRRLLFLPGVTLTTTVETFLDPTFGTFARFTATALLQLFRANATAMGKDALGFTAHEIGTHSNRSIYLNNVPVFTIMLVGRWSSDAFLLYIHKQVQSFTRGVSSRMISTQSFYTIPDELANHEDLLSRNNLANLATCSHQNGCTNSGHNIIGPQFHHWQ